MNKIKAILLAGALVLTLGACGTGGGAGGDSGSASEYTVEVAELDASVHPDNYPLIASADFEAAFEEMMKLNSAGDIKSYQDVVDIFGVDGAYYANNDYDDNGTIYKYYGWYGEASEALLVTFTADGNKLEFFSYSVS